MLDKTIPYYHVLMKREEGKTLSKFVLPAQFKFTLFKPGDEKEWAEIETSVAEFNRAVDALVYFQNDYLPYIKELERRCLFIENNEGLKVATLTIWWCYTGVRRDPWIHWVAVRPEYQGLGLGKALVYEGLRRLLEIEGDGNVYLHTQTWSYKAIGIYKKSGFEITQEKGLGGFQNCDYHKAMELLKKYL
ncbi:GNAT family N-acetyltransferase [Pseudobacteroides cellulosolvens]|uniref:GCN5-related N-acetyltransferase n=1 Tax=Pseudobacteroides cellulosolvens ATCC 35603 = DSM 2933 TaxID=398512 RepID=A0A0L6JKA6_9FIRM|nr:GNAT family N-acetyltransferase [Pseudobacteroides cellulosolvens]KNY26158.1 GCN5-related N-acetyltransferase [Pseudobacteroides cellulosolvens ATCC 35603 = DSM 2933]